MHFKNKPTMTGTIEQEMEAIKRYTEDPKQIKKYFMNRDLHIQNGLAAQCNRNPQKRQFRAEQFDGSTVCAIGKGAFGMVYRVKHHFFKLVAVKKFRNDAPTDAAWKELDVLISLQSDNVVKLLGACVMGSPCLIMELCAGTIFT